MGGKVPADYWSGVTIPGGGGKSRYQTIKDKGNVITKKSSPDNNAGGERVIKGQASVSSCECAARPNLRGATPTQGSLCRRDGGIEKAGYETF